MQGGFLGGDGLCGEGRSVLGRDRVERTTEKVKLNGGFESGRVLPFNRLVLENELQDKADIEGNYLFERECVYYKVSNPTLLDFPYHFLACYKPLSRRDEGFPSNRDEYCALRFNLKRRWI